MDAKTVANYLVYIMSDAFDDLTNMKINKLLYFAQGHYLKKYKVPMFDDTIEAWEHGPVVPEVYVEYKRYGDKPITNYDESAVSEVPPEAENVLYGVARKYGRYTASALRNMTHVVGSPWDLVYQADQAHTEIPLSLIQSYFNAGDDIVPAVKVFKDSDFIGYRDEEGILVLPEDWNDGEV